MKERMTHVKPMRNSCKGNSNKLIAFMAVIIIVLAAVLVYSFALKPVFNGYVIDKQLEAQDIVLNAIMSQLQQNGYVQIPVGDEEVLTLVPYQPEQQQETE